MRLVAVLTADLYVDLNLCIQILMALSKISLSIVVPVYNEERNLQQLQNELNSSLVEMDIPHEVVYVDDGSTDSSFASLRRIYESDPYTTVIRHRVNMGQTQALVTGFKHATGDLIVTIDADLQHNARDINKLVDAIQSGADAVIGWRSYRKESFLRRTIPSRIMNFLAGTLLGLEIHDFGCGLKAYRAECVRNVIVEGEGHLYLPAAIAVRGFKVTEVKISDRERGNGSSKFGAHMMRRQFLDLIFFWFLVRYWRRPMHFFGSIGLILLLMGIGAGAIQFVRFVLYKPATLMTPLSLLAAFLALAGIQFITTGILFEIQMRPYARAFEVEPAVILRHESKARSPEWEPMVQDSRSEST